MRTVVEYLFFITGLVLFRPATAQVSVPSLQELMDSTINKDHHLANQQLDISLSGIDLMKLKEINLPRMDVSGSGAFLLSSFGVKSHEIKIPQLNINIQEGKNRFTMLSSLVTLGTEANMLVYSGGKVGYLKKGLEEKIKAQTVLTEGDKQKLISQVAAVYDQLSLLKQIRIVLDESARRIGEYKRIADKAFNYGLITKYEHQKIEVAQAQLLSKTEEYYGSRELVLQQLHLLTNIDFARLSAINSTLQPFAHHGFDTTIEKRAELKALDAQIAALQYNIKAENTWFIPKVQAAASFGYFGLLGGHISSSKIVAPLQTKLSASLPNLNLLPVFNIGIGFKWNLLDGKEGKRNVQQAIIETEKAKNEKKEAVDKLTLNLVKSQTDYTIANSRIIVKTRQKETAANALEQAAKEYKTGLITSSQLIDAENDFEEASLEYLQAIYNQRRAAIALLQASGSLTLASVQP